MVDLRFGLGSKPYVGFFLSNIRFIAASSAFSWSGDVLPSSFVL
jgi:hypothetical protein